MQRLIFSFGKMWSSSGPRPDCIQNEFGIVQKTALSIPIADLRSAFCRTKNAFFSHKLSCLRNYFCYNEANLFKLTSVPMTMRLILLIYCCFLIPANGCADTSEHMTVQIDGRRYTVELAASPEARKRGLMHRKEIGETIGMLFVYPAQRRLCFYMKNTFIPLDIAFISKNGRIAEIRSMQPMDETPVCSAAKVKYALEVRRGFFARQGIAAGEKLEFAEFD